MKTTTENDSIWAQISDFFCANDLAYTDIESLHVFPIDFSDSFNVILYGRYTDEQLGECISELNTLIYDYFNGSINLVDGGTVYMEVDERTIYLDEKGFMLDPAPVNKKSMYTDIDTAVESISKISPDESYLLEDADAYIAITLSGDTYDVFLQNDILTEEKTKELLTIAKNACETHLEILKEGE